MIDNPVHDGIFHTCPLSGIWEVTRAMNSRKRTRSASGLVTIRTSMGSLLVEWPGDEDRVFQTGPAEFAFVGSFLFK
jgi:diaminopimelate epimerase